MADNVARGSRAWNRPVCPSPSAGRSREARTMPQQGLRAGPGGRARRRPPVHGAPWARCHPGTGPAGRRNQRVLGGGNRPLASFMLSDRQWATWVLPSASTRSRRRRGSSIGQQRAIIRPSRTGSGPSSRESFFRVPGRIPAGSEGRRRPRPVWLRTGGRRSCSGAVLMCVYIDV